MKKAFVYLVHKIGALGRRALWLAAALLVAVLLVRATAWYGSLYQKFTDNDPGRGAAVVSADVFGDKFHQVKYLEQGWTAADSLWFYSTTQGSNLLPYDFFLHVEQEKAPQPFRAPENINRYRYLPQRPTTSNPDGLPLGMVADTYLGKKYMGFTCAACHTTQVNYNGVGIRIDGGPGAADMDGFMNDLWRALAATKTDPAKRQRFVAAVKNSGNYSDEAEILRDLDVYTLRMEAYNFFNDSFKRNDDGTVTPVPYGYARLDAFGRIYNRVLEHVLNPDALREILTGALPLEQSQALLEKMKPVLTSKNRDHLMERLVALLSIDQRRALRDRVFNPPNAPVSYPFLWDIPQHDYVQWNGIGANGGVGPIGRNAGEVIGVFGTLDWQQKKGWTISSVLGGQGFGETHISFQSSVNVHNLRQLEDRLWSLQSPRWEDPAAGLPAIDPAKRDRGEKLFVEHCATCHANIDRSSDSRRIVAHMDKVSAVGTDAAMTNNSVKYDGFSGILRNMYMKAGVGAVLLNTKAPVAAILTTATENVVATPSPDKWWFTRAAEWAVDLFNEYTGNDIKPSVKSGDYTPDTTAAPFQSLQSYKGRALNGIWATAPYLHNGSVPTLYDLLLPAADRPKKFRVGSRELDVKKVGLKHGESEYDGFLFDTSQFTNSNAGHEYGTKLTDPQREDLVEYLKSL